MTNVDPTLFTAVTLMMVPVPRKKSWFLPVLAGIAVAALANFPWIIHHPMINEAIGKDWLPYLNKPAVAIGGTGLALILVFWGITRLLANRDPDRALANTLERRGDFRGGAELHLRSGNPRRALKLFKKAKDWPGAAQAAVKAGQPAEAAELYRRAGGSYFEEATRLFQRANQPESAIASTRDHARWLCSKGRHDEAIEVWQRARDFPRAVHTANTALEKGRIRPNHAAFEVARRVAQQANDHPLLARLHELEGQWERAARNWLEAGQYAQAASGFSRAGLLREAAAAELTAGNKERSVALRITHLESLQGKLKLMESQGQDGSPQHTRIVTVIQEETESLIPLLNELGRVDDVIRVLTTAGRTEEAIDHLLRTGQDGAAAELARDARLWDLAAPILERLSRWGEAGDVHELNGNLEKAAMCAEKTGEDERALTLWRALGRTVEAARCQARIGGLQEALLSLHGEKLFDEALAVLGSNPGPVPDIPNVILDLAAFKKKKGQQEQSIACLQRAVLGVALQPGRLDPAIALAQELLEIGEYESARSHLNRVLAFDYSYPPAMALKEKIMAVAGETPARDASASTGKIAATVPPTQRYEIRHELGRGGMGVVYLAGDTRLGRDVAIKVLRTTSKDEAARLETEARVAATLNHPGIVTIFDFEAGFDGYFIAMEYVQGEPLSTLLKKNPELVKSQLPTMLRRIARALHYAHANNVIHRDLKPANILRTPEGAVKLLDFGIATRLDSEDGDSSPVCGTPYYMAPEQIRGEAPSPASDIYSLGATAFHLATGRPPFSTGNVINAHLQQEPPDPKLLAPDLDVGLAEIILTCLNKLPNERFRSCRELGLALKDL